MTETLGMTPLGRALGIALVHFMWQGALVAVVVAAGLSLCRRTGPQTRYLVACVGLALMFAWPVITAGREWRGARTSSTPARSFEGPPVEAAAVDPAAPTADVASATGRRAPRWIDRQLPWITTVWGVGVTVSALHLCHGWLRLRRARRRAAPVTSPPWTTALETMAARVGVTRTIAMVESAFTDTPAVIGHLRPIVLVPAAALSGLTPRQVEAILAHELAHIRRADYLVNLAQCAIEALLFYHPAVWWVSGVIRHERELCCDDVAIAACRDRVQYARALVLLEELRLSAAALAVGANGGDLVARVRRIVGDTVITGPQKSGGITMSVVMTVLVLAIGGTVAGLPAADPVALTPQRTDAVAAVVPTLASGSVLPQSIRVDTSRTPTNARRARRESVQDARGAVMGRVMDQSGGTLPGVSVTTVPASGVRDQLVAMTSASGEFRFDNIPAGPYDLLITMPGFRSVRARVSVAAGLPTAIDVRLQIGGLMESVSVRSTTASAGPARADAAGLFEAARVLGEQGRITEAEEMAARAIAALKANPPATTAVQPRAPAPAVQNPGAPRTPIRVGGDIRAPRKMRDVRPIYPAEALAANVSGMVLIEATIGKDGSVSDARVLRSVPLLDDAALTAVRQWLYSPTLLNGMPVDVVVMVTVTFDR